MNPHLIIPMPFMYIVNNIVLHSPTRVAFSVGANLFGCPNPTLWQSTAPPKCMSKERNTAAFPPSQRLLPGKNPGSDLVIPNPDPEMTSLNLLWGWAPFMVKSPGEENFTVPTLKWRDASPCTSKDAEPAKFTQSPNRSFICHFSAFFMAFTKMKPWETWRVYSKFTIELTFSANQFVLTLEKCFSRGASMALIERD